jgi:predicted transcriptional regulator
MQNAPPKREGLDLLAGSPEADYSNNTRPEDNTTPHSVRCFLALAAAAKDSRLSRADIACLAVILDRFNRSTGAAWPGINRLATEANLHRSNVIRAVQRLEQTGYVTVERTGQGKSNRYRPTFITGSASATSSKPATSRDNATEVVAPARLELVAPTRPEPAYRTYPENLPNKSAPAELFADRFDDFWKAYPRKTGSIPKARNSWVSQKLDQQADSIIATVIDRAANDPQWSDPKFIPYPTTFLNQQRWNDEWVPVKKKPSAADRFTGKTYEGSSDDELPAWAR